jgi:hypothetical protein
MKKLDTLLLQSNNDIPFEEAQVTIHNPTLKEIALYGEEVFHIGLHFLVFSKNILPNEDKKDLEKFSDFDIFMSVMSSNSIQAEHKTDAKKLLDLLFPGFELSFKKDQLLLRDTKNNITSIINNQNYQTFKDILGQLFCLEQSGHNPTSAMAKAIAEKLAKARQKLDKIKQSDSKIGIYDKYVSVLAIGLQKSKQELMNYTVYQIVDEFQRFIKKFNWDTHFKLKVAGAQNLDEVDNWME